MNQSIKAHDNNKEESFKDCTLKYYVEPEQNYAAGAFEYNGLLYYLTASSDDAEKMIIESFTQLVD